MGELLSNGKNIARVMFFRVRPTPSHRSATAGLNLSIESSLGPSAGTGAFLALLRTKASEAGPLAGPFPSREAGSRRLPSLLREYGVYGNVKQQSGRTD